MTARVLAECTHPRLDLPEDPPGGAAVRESTSVRGTYVGAPRARLLIREEATCALAACDVVVASYRPPGASPEEARLTAFCCGAHRKEQRRLDRAADPERAARVAAEAQLQAAAAARKAARRAAQPAPGTGKRARAQAMREQLAAAASAREAAERAVELAASAEAEAERVAREEAEVARERELAEQRALERRCLDPAWRARTCPRPDKEPWLTREVAADIVRIMREQGRPRAENLRPYLCADQPGSRPGCGAYHVGDGTVFDRLAQSREEAAREIADGPAA